MRWLTYHPNPRISYYLFLRRVYGMYADEALAYVNRVGDALTPRDTWEAFSLSLKDRK